MPRLASLQVHGRMSVCPARSGLGVRALQINSSFYSYSFCQCMQPACQRPGGLARRCLSPALHSVWVLQMVFIQSRSAEGGHSKCDGGRPTARPPSSLGHPSQVRRLHPTDLQRVRGCRLPPSPGPRQLSGPLYLPLAVHLK